jgi:hypothetical protein
MKTKEGDTVKTNKVQFAHISVGPRGIRVRFVRENTVKTRQATRQADKDRLARLINESKDTHTWFASDGAQKTEIHNS